MVLEGTGRLFRRKDGKFLIYIPKDLAEDSQFPFKIRARPRSNGLGWQHSERVNVRVELGSRPRLVITREKFEAE